MNYGIKSLKFSLMQVVYVDNQRFNSFRHYAWIDRSVVTFFCPDILLRQQEVGGAWMDAQSKAGD